MINKALLFMFFCFLLTACSGSDGDVRDIPAPDSNNPEIRLKADVWQMMEGTRATTYDNAALQSNGFKCAVYEINTITPYIASVNVNWGGSGWAFSDGSHEWHPDGTPCYKCCPAYGLQNNAA